ncbi:MAG: hypothetical protein IKE14_02025 [Loktanella sp.]|jgi:hypothetical protein|nr:hypothetical protein [Yoonia sp.]MBR2573085.1 hypothetical protein [Loktanella sp.]
MTHITPSLPPEIMDALHDPDGRTMQRSKRSSARPRATILIAVPEWRDRGHKPVAA